MNIKVGDPGAENCKVFFNGIQINDCIAADEEQRFVVRYCRDADGNFKKVPSLPFETDFVTTKEYGDVRIEL